MSKRYIPTKIRNKVKNMFGGRCAYCGHHSNRLHIDHKVPIANEHSTSEISNLLPACPCCNNFKGVFSMEQFRENLKLQVERANKYSINYRLAKKFGQIIETPTPIVFLFEKENKI